MQFVLTAIILIGAIGYALWRVYDALNGNGDPCKTCEIKKNCKKFGQSKKK
jgi:hypothetical protein